MHGRRIRTGGSPGTVSKDIRNGSITVAADLRPGSFGNVFGEAFAEAQ